MSDVPLLLNQIALHAREMPTRSAFSFSHQLGFDDISWSQLHDLIQSIGYNFTKRGVSRGDTILIVTSSPKEQILSFLGAIACGAVPSILSHPSAKQAVGDFCATLNAIIERTNAPWLVVAPEFLAAIVKTAAPSRGLILTVDLRKTNGTASFARRQDHLPLFLQFSSGTTGLRKSVAITSQMLHRQAEAYGDRLGMNAAIHTVVSWLPLYHDMGLVAAFLIPLLLGVSSVHLSPFAWLAKPEILFDAIAVRGSVFVWLPNFAYPFLAQRLREQGPRSGWSLANVCAFINCSEPVRHDSHLAFFREFESIGCRMDQLQACYASAETTFAVTQTDVGQPARLDTIDSASFQTTNQARAVTTDAASTTTFVSCGRPIAGASVRIAGAVSDRQVGEIEVAGDFVFSGYYSTADARDGVFTDDGWYRTGDLGYLSDAELFVVGRRKDLIIHRGSNLHPSDIEETLGSLSGFKAGRVVVFGVYDDSLGTERVVAMAETTADVDRPDELARRAREITVGKYAFALSDIVLCPPGSLLKSTSGKLSRGKNRDVYLRGARERDAITAEMLFAHHDPHHDARSQADLLSALRASWQQALVLASLGDDDDFFSLGGDSLRAAAVQAKVSRELGIDIPALTLLSHSTVASYAQFLEARYPEHVRARYGPRGLERARVYSGSPRGFIKVHEGSGPNLFLLPPGWGTPYPYLTMRGLLPRSAPTLYALVAPPLMDDAIGWSDEHLLQKYFEIICALQPSGPHLLGGWSLGASHALRLSQKFAEAGRPVSRLVLFDLPLPAGRGRRLNDALVSFAAFLSRHRGLVADHAFEYLLSRSFTKVLGALFDDAKPSVAELRRMLSSPLFRRQRLSELGLEALDYDQLCETMIALLSQNPTIETSLKNFLPASATPAEQWKMIRYALRTPSSAERAERKRWRLNPGSRFEGLAIHLVCRDNRDPYAWNHHFLHPPTVRAYDVQPRRGLDAHGSMFDQENVQLFIADVVSFVEAAPKT